MQSRSGELAPWVLQARHEDSTYFAGRGLGLVRVSGRTRLTSIWPDQRSAFFVPPSSDVDSSPAPSRESLGSEPHVLIFDRTGTPTLARAIIARLALNGTRASFWVPESPSVPVVMIHHIEERIWTETHQAIASRHPLIWMFEAPTGPFLGPVIRTENEWRDFIADSSAFTDEDTLDRLFPDRRPCAIGVDTADAGRIAAAIGCALSDLRPGTVWPIGGDTPRLLPSTARRSALDWEACASLEWDFGLFRNRTSAMVSTPVGDVFLESCRSPAGRINPTLESNSGKGWSRSDAETTMRGEAVERTAAFWANSLETVDVGSDDIALSELAPFGPLWEHRRELADRDERVHGVDLLTGRVVTAPLVAVAFPYVPRDGRPRPSSGDTTGLAAFPTRSGAVLRGLREVLERESLYTNLLHEKGGVREPVEGIGPMQIWRYWFDDLPFPAIHTVVVVDGPARVMGRGTGSALTWSDARESSLLEAVQIFEQMRRGAPAHGGDAYDIWSARHVQEAVLSYLQAMPIGVPRKGLETHSDEVQLRSTLEHLQKQGRRAIAIDLPSPMSDICAVRVLVPGAVTNVHTTASVAGAKLEGTTWEFGIPV